MLFNYIWRGQLIELLIIQKLQEWWLRMIHIESFIKVLKLTWLRRLAQQAAPLQILLHALLLRSHLHTVLTQVEVFRIIWQTKTKNQFWREVFY